MIVLTTLEINNLKEYREILKDHQRMKDEIPGSSDIDPILLKEGKKAFGMRVMKEIKNHDSAAIEHFTEALSLNFIYYYKLFNSFFNFESIVL